MVRLSDGEKKFEDTFIRFDTIHEHDKQPVRGDRQTPHDGIGRAYVAVRYCEPYRPSHSEEASLHPGLYKRLRAVVVGFLAIAVMEVDL